MMSKRMIRNNPSRTYTIKYPAGISQKQQHKNSNIKNRNIKNSNTKNSNTKE